MFYLKELKSGDAKFYGEYVVTNANGAMRIYDKNGGEIKTYDNINANWVDCEYERKLIVYCNFANQLGLIELDENLNIDRK